MAKSPESYEKTVSLLKRAAMARRAPRPGRGGGHSVLDVHRIDLTELYNSGASTADLQMWLAAEKEIIVERSTIWRRLKRWKEVKLRG